MTDQSNHSSDAVPRDASSAAFAKAASDLESSLIPGSIDDIFIRLGNRYEGFGGVYENDEGQLVVVSKQPEQIASREVASELFAMMKTSERARNAYLSKQVIVQRAAFSFRELAVYRDVIERNLQDIIPIVETDVDERQNLVTIGLDEAKDADLEDALSRATKLGIPRSAIAIAKVVAPTLASANGVSEPEAPSLLPLITDYVRPLAGGLQIDRNGRCTMGIPVWYGSPGYQTRGFLTASHCTGFVGYNNGSQWGQPWLSSYIGTEYEDPPLTNCGAGSTNCHLTDAALIDLDATHDTGSMTHPGSIYLTNYSSSTGAGGKTVTSELGPLWTQSPFSGQDVNKVGMATGWTAGEVTGTCVTAYVSVRHPDGVFRTTKLSCYIRASTPVNGGDSGSGLFSILYDPEPEGGGFLGILSACSGCIPNVSTTAYYVSWSAIDQAMTSYITLTEDQGGD